jgi:hypothetical protein
MLNSEVLFLGWLANASVDALQPHAAEIYAMLFALRCGALIPIDNVHKVKRLNAAKVG